MIAVSRIELTSTKDGRRQFARGLFSLFLNSLELSVRYKFRSRLVSICRIHNPNPLIIVFVIATITLLGAKVGSAQLPKNSDQNEINIFQSAANLSQQRRYLKSVAALVRYKRFEEAEKALLRLISRFPDWHMAYYNLAVVLARQGKYNDALRLFATAIKHGFSDRRTADKEPGFNAMRDMARFQEILAKMQQNQAVAAPKARRSTKPQLVSDRLANIDATNTVWVPQIQALISTFKFSETPKTQIVHGGDTRISRILNKWFRRGQGAGNHGDLYDNRDNGHSSLAKDLFPQMTHTSYHTEAREAGVHYGVNSLFLFNTVLFGNSSTAIMGRRWRSQARLIMTQSHLITKAYQQYANNHLYIYPEHRDHDAESGDLFPANTPYMIISQGSSGSDRPFMHAMAATLAAFKPDVKKFLRDRKLVMPTFQMILRSSLKSLRTPEEYLTAKAHPTVFDAAEIDVEKMIFRAQELSANDVPPQVKISVLAESKLKPSVNYFGAGNRDEILFDTPSAVARVVRSTDYKRRMLVSAALTSDPNDRPVTFTWKVLRGDADRIRIAGLDGDSATVELQIPWHIRRPVPYTTELTTNRVDIAVFAHNGIHYSAPALISLYYPPNQSRHYDDTGRLLEIDYAAPDLKHRYSDPALIPLRPWRDKYFYTKSGQLLGWNRFSDSEAQRYSRHGALVLGTDSEDRPTRVEIVRYEAKRIKGGALQIFEIQTGTVLNYQYYSTADRLGRLSHSPKR